MARLQRDLPDTTNRALQLAVSAAERCGVGLYLVGGGVRDLLLDAPRADLDLVVEGDALALASNVGAALHARVVAHARFGTAVLRGEGVRLDVAQARAERYERPGALPKVRPARLEDDLARRDFTINAIALRLSGPQAGTLVDPHGGQKDLGRRQLRVLHDKSFRDDATRILRAVRYAARLEFELQRETEELVRRDLAYLETISASRLRKEFEHIADEERVADAMDLASRLRVLTGVHPALHAGKRALQALRALPDVASSHRSAVLFALLLAEASLEEAEDAIGRLSLTALQMAAVRGLLALREQEAKLARASLRPSEAFHLLSPHAVVAVESFSLIAKHSLADSRARSYLNEGRLLRPRLTGRDVEALGIPHGPQIGAALKALREARLDGRTDTREEEVRMVAAMRNDDRSLSGVRRE